MNKLTTMSVGCVGVFGGVVSAVIGGCTGLYYGEHWIRTHPADRVFPSEMIEFGVYGFVIGPILFAGGFAVFLWWLSRRKPR
jgi:hypothetical protein